MKKVCSRCKIEKDEKEFHRKGVNNPKLRHICKICHNDVSKRDTPKYNLKKKYGLDLSTFSTMKEKQENCCAICGEEKKLCVDHDHKTGRVRKLLCMNCNTALGAFKDDVNLLLSAILYLQNYED